MNKENILYEYLVSYHRGRKNAVHSKTLEKEFGICPRTVRKYINNMRKSGIPVCSDDSGYWIGTTSKEVNDTIKRLGDFIGEVGNARTGLAFANTQMNSVTEIRQERIEITIKVG